MIKCFLSHSSTDKTHYVKIVADKLGEDQCVYDEYTFEEGMKTFEEIVKGLNSSQIFVIFISNKALESAWVKKELNIANDLLKNGNMKRIFPIIIDPSVTYADKRIPDWMRDFYNIKPIYSPKLAARRIEQKLREITWNKIPLLQERENFFVGRNNETDEVEQRIYDPDRHKPVCIFASGWRDIGRSSFLKYCIRKTDIVPQSYIPPVIQLGEMESLDDLILKIENLGFTESESISKIMNMDVAEKKALLLQLLLNIKKSREIVFIKDHLSIVTREGAIASWFMDTLEELKSESKLMICILCSYKINYLRYRDIEHIYHIHIPELSSKDRNKLMSKYADFRDIDIPTDDYNNFLGLQFGFPGQIYLTVDMIKQTGVDQAKKDAIKIVDYSRSKASYIIEKYDQEHLNILAILSKFELIDYAFLSELINDNDNYRTIIDDFLLDSVCEHYGANKEYLKVSDIIRDYVLRNKMQIPDPFKEKIKQHLETFLESLKTNKDDYEFADYMFSLKEALHNKIEFESSLLIPSHFLKVIKELYDIEHKYESVIFLADRILKKHQKLDTSIQSKIRYYLCLSLARTRDNKCLSEVQKINGPEHSFIKGFYYRQLRRYEDAITSFAEALKQNPRHLRAKNELVLSHLALEEFDKAFLLAKQVHEAESTNPYYIQSYFNCLIHQERNDIREAELKRLILSMEHASLDKAKEMKLSMEALYHSFYLKDKSKALDFIDDAINQFPDSSYPKINKLRICIFFNDPTPIKDLLTTLSKEITNKSTFYFALISAKAQLLVKEGNMPEANRLIDTELRSFPESARKTLKNRIEQNRIDSYLIELQPT